MHSIALSFALFMSLLAPALAQTATPPTALAGLWGTEKDFGPNVSGRLTIARAPSELVATIGAAHTPVTLAGEELRFALPGNQGKFRGRLHDGALEGFWIQPATPVLGVEYASPIAFAGGKGHWTGTVAPLADRLTLYLSITAQADGHLAAFLRNPQMNLGRGHEFAVTQSGSDVTLTDTKTHQPIMRGKLSRDALTLVYLGPNIEFDFARRDPATAMGFNERALAQPYVYAPPAARDDGWKTGTLGDAGIDEKAIAALARSIADTKAAAGTTPYIDALLIARHGRLVFEEYFDGFDRDTPHTLRSAGKTLTSILLGAAIDHGAPIAVTTPVLSLFPGPIGNPDPRKDRMTIENLLTMSSGLACDDDDDNSPGNEDTMQNQSAEPDWYKYTLDLPMLGAPGEKAIYCSGGVNVVYGALRNATRRWVPELFDDYLARPLDIKRYYMNLRPTEDAYGGGGIFIAPRDALKFGQLYLDGGVWNGKRVVSKAWVDASTATHAKIHDDSTYGYNWWLFKLKVGDKTYDEYEAGGNGGQIIAVIPALDTVILINAANYGRFDIWYKFQTDLIPNVILPAMK
jgi:CubicO group peptidase (beta-lactamase class C family)